ncbi:MAG: MBL fold metallo-hydrolase [Thermoplasmata archaeon]|nr:MAG: MBL fold metallo-hydrolase [Thermoplasmata archaeon]
MKITPLASDSMGTRSMATFIETKDTKVLIDPGVALGPYRYGLEPHPLEWERMDEDWKKIKRYAKKAKVLIVTHYHYDHHDPDEPGVFKNKILFTKHPKENINKSQKKRARYFLNQLGELPKEIEFSDGNEFSFGKTTIRFSEAVPHGTNTKLGYVTEVCVIEGRDRFVYTSDVQGPSLKDQLQFILDERPKVIFCDGPMTYMLGFRYSKKNLKKSVRNINRIIRETKVKKFVLDHHLLRDLGWKEQIKRVFAQAKKKKVKIMTIAEFAGEKNDMFEARRKELYEGKILE